MKTRREKKPRRSKLRQDAPRVITAELLAASNRKHLTVEEWRRVRKVLEASEKRNALRDKALILSMYAVGARRDEPGVWTLSYVNKISQCKMYVFRGKGSVKGMCEVPPYVAEVLVEWIIKLYPEYHTRLADAFVFPGSRYKGREADGLSGRSVYRIYNSTAKAAGLPQHLQHPHVLKRSRGQHLLEGGMAEGRSREEMIPIIARVLGHKNIAVTRKHYLAETEADKQLVRDLSAKETRKE